MSDRSHGDWLCIDAVGNGCLREIKVEIAWGIMLESKKLSDSVGFGLWHEPEWTEGELMKV